MFFNADANDLNHLDFDNVSTLTYGFQLINQTTNIP